MLDGRTSPSFSSSHSIAVSASPQDCYPCLRKIDIGRSLPIRAMLVARGLRHLRTLERATDAGFVILEEDEPHRIILGLAGQPWRPSGGLQRMSAQEFMDFDEPGFVKVFWSFIFEETPTGCSVSTSTEIYATDTAARRRFGRYWWFVRPFSGMLRRSMLRSIRTCAQG